MSEVRVHLERSRPVCPFCKGELGGGLVWVCPDCGAAHHADCHQELRACATCGPVKDASTRRAARRAQLRRLRAAAEGMGFRVIDEGEDRFFALHPALPDHDGHSQAHALLVVTAPAASRRLIEADLVQLSSQSLAHCPSTLLYVSDAVDDETADWLDSTDGARFMGHHAQAPFAWGPARGLSRPKRYHGLFYRHHRLALDLIAGAGLPPAGRRPEPTPAAPPPRPAPAPPSPPPAAAPPRIEARPPATAPSPAQASDAEGVAIALAAAVGVAVLLIALAMAAAG